MKCNLHEITKTLSLETGTIHTLSTTSSSTFKREATSQITATDGIFSFQTLQNVQSKNTNLFSFT